MFIDFSFKSVLLFFLCSGKRSLCIIVWERSEMSKVSFWCRVWASCKAAPVWDAVCVCVCVCVIFTSKTVKLLLWEQGIVNIRKQSRVVLSPAFSLFLSIYLSISFSKWRDCNSLSIECLKCRRLWSWYGTIWLTLKPFPLCAAMPVLLSVQPSKSSPP